MTLNKTKAEKTLDKLKINETAIVTAVDCADAALRKHVFDMGLTPGAEVALIKAAPMGDPLELRLRGYELTLRKADAAKIRISGIKSCSACPHCRQCHAAPPEIAHAGLGENIGYPARIFPSAVEKSSLRLALAGNQNCGKTTLFNKLTGANRHVGNFPGVTVDRAEGILKSDGNVVITDLPGIYSLSPYSKEEIISRNFILNEKPDGIINIVDASNIERNLFLTMQLIELDIPMVIALNMMDEVKQSGGTIDINGLEATLGVPVIPISAAKNQGLAELAEHAVNVARRGEHPGRLDFCSPDIEKEKSVHQCTHAIAHLIESEAKACGLPVKFAAAKLAENDRLVAKALRLGKDKQQLVEQIISDMEKERRMDRQAALADARFSFIERLCALFVRKEEETPARRMTQNIDKVLTGKWTAFPSFLGIMALIFYLTFGPLGAFLSDIAEQGIARLSAATDAALAAYGLNPVVKSLIIDGVFAGVGSVLSFLPVIVILFFCLSVLEDTGYMARVAFVMDRLLRKIGLSGRSFVPMLIGFGCSVPAIMATRTLPSERDRKMTIFLTPFMSCSAKLPIYALFTAAFFAERRITVVISLYLIGILVGIMFACVLKRFVFKGEPVPFVMELPNYRFPSAVNVYRLIMGKAKDFAAKAFTIIFWATIIVWFFQNFDIRLNRVQNPADSILAIFGSLLVPLFEPLGISDWRITTAFLTGFMAKESVVSTLSILLDGNISLLPQLFTPLTAFVFLVFSLLYTPCVATIAMVRRELGTRYAVTVVLLQCAIAWLVALAVYRLALLIL